MSLGGLQRVDRLTAWAGVRIVAGERVSCRFQLPEVSYEQFWDGRGICFSAAERRQRVGGGGVRELSWAVGGACEAPEDGTPWPAIVQCVRCHTEENCPHFEYLTGWGKIRHGGARGGRRIRGWQDAAGRNAVNGWDDFTLMRVWESGRGRFALF